MQLCNCVTAWAGTKPCPQSSSDHHSPSLLVLSLSGAVVHKLIHLLYQAVLLQTEHPGASRVVLCQTKAAHHIVNGKLLGLACWQQHRASCRQNTSRPMPQSNDADRRTEWSLSTLPILCVQGYYFTTCFLPFMI